MHYGVTVPNFGDYFDPRTLADIAREAEAAEWDGFDQGLGDGGRRRFDWYFNGDTPIRHYADAAKQGVPVPPFKLSSNLAHVLEERRGHAHCRFPGVSPT